MRFLSTVCLLIISCLTISVVSPEVHSSLFHGDQQCSHGKTGLPCSSEGSESSENTNGLCAVVLYGESSEPTFFQLSYSSSLLLDLGISRMEVFKEFRADSTGINWARGPPEQV